MSSTGNGSIREKVKSIIGNSAPANSNSQPPGNVTAGVVVVGDGNRIGTINVTAPPLKKEETTSSLSLSSCPVCSRQVSIFAVTCPHCSHPVKAHLMALAASKIFPRFVAWYLIVLFICIPTYKLGPPPAALAAIVVSLFASLFFLGAWHKHDKLKRDAFGHA